jgi:hypothetical protein
MNDYLTYTSKDSIDHAFDAQEIKLSALFETITEEKSMYRYAEGKWSIKTLVLHLVDSERVFSYRAMSIARGETEILPAFDEDVYALNSEAESLSWGQIQEEFWAVRKATRLLFSHTSERARLREGKFSSNVGSPVHLFRLTIGHVAHHVTVLEERYF